MKFHDFVDIYLYMFVCVCMHEGRSVGLLLAFTVNPITRPPGKHLAEMIFLL